ncbi:transmembrane channel-like protein 5 isoform X1 [Lepisosteus oculatus]|uniref:transmembrane channel-like protein 5 isoform X1 n=1 Tax=Lepisosteus oculatus TaxID=7918 RepID=UPI0035F51044
MSYYSQGGVLNPAYHQSETLEMDRSSSRTAQPLNPYDSSGPGGQRDRGAGGWSSTGMLPPYGEEGGYDTLPMRPLPTQTRPALEHRGQTNRGFERDSVIEYNSGPQDWYQGRHHVDYQDQPDYSRREGSALRRRASRRRSLFPAGTLSATALGRLGLTAEDFREEIEREEQDLVTELAAKSIRDRVRAIRQLPMSLQDKSHVRKQVLLLVTSKRRLQLTCCTDCTESVSLFFRRLGGHLSSVRQALELWSGTLKEIGGRFGSSVLSFFTFLKWLLMFNVFSFLINFGFITVPQLLEPPGGPNVSFRGLEILTGSGYFSYTVLYYGYYSNGSVSGSSAGSSQNSTLPQYDMRLAYFFTMGTYLVLCGLCLVYSAARSFRENFMLGGELSGRAWRLLCSWDFSVVNEKAVQLRQRNLQIQLKESLSESAQKQAVSSLSEKLSHFGIHLGIWLISLSLALGSCAAVYFLCLFNLQLIENAQTSSSLQDEASTLLLPIVVSLINLLIPLLYTVLRKIEPFTVQRHQIYTLILRNVILKMSIVGVLCYYWLEKVTNSKIQCWESFVGQDLYRLVVIDFFFCLIGSFFGEFLHRVIGVRCVKSLGVPEFDIARNVLDLIYAQTLAWIGIYFSPLLPVIQIIKFFLMFYLKKVSLMQNCQPPRRLGRAAQIQTIFILLLFFPSFAGVLSMVAVTVWRRKPSALCGPFRGLHSPYEAVSLWMSNVDMIPGSRWAVWIYNNLIQSVLFFLLLSLVILVLIYLYWHIVRGRKILILLLREQIANEGKDKTFLLEKLKKLQGLQTQGRTSVLKPQRGAVQVKRGRGTDRAKRQEPGAGRSWAGREHSQEREPVGTGKGQVQKQKITEPGSTRVNRLQQGPRLPSRDRVPSQGQIEGHPERVRVLCWEQTPQSQVSGSRGRVVLPSLDLRGSRRSRAPGLAPGPGARDTLLPGSVPETPGPSQGGTQPSRAAWSADSSWLHPT